MKSFRKLTRVMAVGLVFLLITLAHVFADSYTVDGNTVLPGNQNILNLSLQTGESYAGYAQIVVNYQGNNHVTAGELLLFPYSPQNSTPPPNLSASGIQVAMPADWGAGQQTASGGAAFSFTAPAAPGSYTYTLKWQEPQGWGNALTGGAALVINLDVVGGDTSAPALTLPADMTVEATGPDGAAVSFVATAADDQDPNPAVSCSPAPGTVFPLGDTTVTCSATDAAGNTVSGTFTVSVVDTTPPALNLPGDMTVDPNNAQGYVLDYSASAADLVDGAVPVSCSVASGENIGFGATTITCSATDAHGNTSTGSFTIMVNNLCVSPILPPITVDGRSAFKSGSTIPVKFQLCGSAAGFTDLQAFLSVYSVGADQTLTPVSTSKATTGAQFRYDAVASQYIYNLNTKGWTAGVYEVQIALPDGQVLTAQFMVKP